ncbi:hypothetical protein ACN28I_41890 [Archangium gephyra]|uniref:hypothetical protein n=1 Tax=Archangium gephyra TaxID=48 RepID=UPI003B7C483D
MASKSSNTVQHPNQFIEGVLTAIHELIPSTNVKCRNTTLASLQKERGFNKQGISGHAGGTHSDNQFTIWINTSGEEAYTIEISRPSTPLTRRELKVLGRLPDALAGLLTPAPSKNLQLAQRISGRLSLEHLLIYKFLRGGHASTYWTPALTITQLQELTYRRYEGTLCTSGFIYTSQPQLYLPRIKNTPYGFTHFPEAIRLAPTHFSSPASFRYVDGKNSFYLIDNLQRIHGIISNTTPKNFGVIDRSSHLHISPLVEQMPGRVWVTYVGNNSDVNIHMSGGIHFRWEKNHWHLRDKSILESILEDHGCSKDLTSTLTSVAYTLSDLRLGAALLIPDDDTRIPKIIGVIDGSDLGKSLRKSFLNRSFQELVSSNSALGILSSDGLTTVSKSGILIGCGDIIDISSSAAKSLAGGGRTQAARAAAEYGLSIKISEDGPISVFKNGEQIIRL